MFSPKPLTKENFLQRARRLLLPKKGAVPPELQQAIKDCTTMSELLSLLFAMDFMDEATIDAFDRRIDELERCSTVSFDYALNLHLKTRNNANRTV